jgi:arabinan endo-1,5-alpha-L-arabinosidase
MAVPSRALQGATGAHDPSSIVKLNGVYHIWTTGNQIYHITSTDLINWTVAPTVFASGTWPSWINSYVSGFAGDFWAPFCVQMNGKYFMYYACSTGSKPCAIGVATSTDLTNWTDQGMVVYSNSSTVYGSIDPSVFQDTSGNWWLTWGSHLTGIWTAQISPSTGKFVNSNKYNIMASNGSSSDNENSLVIPHGGYYYVFSNRGVCCNGVNSTYYIQMGRATSPTGPYYDKSGKALLSGGGTNFITSSMNFIGPGGLGYFKNSDNTEYLTYHYYDGNNNGAPTLEISHTLWGSDGWPINSPDWIANGTYKIVNNGNGLAWDDWGCTGASLQAIAENTYWGGTCQKWVFKQLGYGSYEVTCALGGLSSDVYNCSPAAGSKLDIYSYWGGSCQQWRIERYANGSYVFESLNGNRVVDIPNGTNTTGTQLQIFDYNGLWTQQWNVLAP